MTTPNDPAERAELLRLRGEVQRLRAGLALQEARDEAASLRRLALVPGLDASTALRVAGRLATHPFLLSAAVGIAGRLVRRHPFAVVLGVAAGVAAARWIARGTAAAPPDAAAAATATEMPGQS